MSCRSESRSTALNRCSRHGRLSQKSWQGERLRPIGASQLFSSIDKNPERRLRSHDLTSSPYSGPAQRHALVCFRDRGSVGAGRRRQCRPYEPCRSNGRRSPFSYRFSTGWRGRWGERSIRGRSDRHLPGPTVCRAACTRLLQFQHRSRRGVARLQAVLVHWHYPVSEVLHISRVTLSRLKPLIRQPGVFSFDC